MRAYYNDQHIHHDPQSFIFRGQVAQCPETPERASILLDAVRRGAHEVCSPDTFSDDKIARVHDPRLVEFLTTAWSDWEQLPGHAPEIIPNVHPSRNMDAEPVSVVAKAGRYQADTACPIGVGTWQAVRSAVDTALSAASAVMTDLDSGDGSAFAYALCRPPGHHAFADQAGGFCYLNNTAIAAQHCRDSGARRVAILDVDVHHGNGTQGIFYDRNDVLTVSLHGDPEQFYPFYLGYSDERGTGAGAGFNCNFPLPYGTPDVPYLAALEKGLEAIRQFNPDILVLALGLDASEHDGHMPFLKVTTSGFRQIGERIGRLGLATILVQEGGYVSHVLGDNLDAALAGFESTR